MAATLYDSLVIGGVIELAGGPGGVVSTNPMCPGAVFGLDPGAWDLGAPQPTTDFVATLVVDGERPFGTRTSDRTAKITVYIKAPDFLTLAGARELLLTTIDAQQWTMTWTPRLTQAQDVAGQGPLPVVYDCFRAHPSKMRWGGATGMNNEPVGQIDIEFEALPYGRSDEQQQLAFTSPVAALNAPSAPPAPVVLDNFGTINNPQCAQSTVCVVGPFSCYWDPQGPPFSTSDGANCPLTYSAQFTSPVSLVGMTALKLWVGLGSRFYYNHHPRGRTRVQIAYTLTDVDGQTLSWTVTTQLLPVSQSPQNPAWSIVSVRIPATNPAFNLAGVESYSLTMTNRGRDQHRDRGEFRWTCVTMDALIAYPSTSAAAPAAPSVRGTIFDVHGVVGTHYAPVSVTAQGPPTAGTATVIGTAGAGNYTVPANTVYCSAQAIGGGGPGATMTVAGVGGGGGGGEEASEPNIPGSTGGVVIPYKVGAGGSPGTAGQSTQFGPVPNQTLVVTANGGLAAVANSPAGAAGGDGSPNSGHFPGGAGRTAGGGLGGGGGSSAGTAAAGNTPSGTSTQVFATSGTWVQAATATVTIGLTGGGGGGASGQNSGNEGAGGGGGGYLAVSVTLPAGSYPYTVGAAGTGGSASGGGNHSGTSGGNTSITIAGTTYTAHGGSGGPPGGPSTPGGSGGSGSAGEQPGGQGGAAVYGSGGGSSAGPGAAGNPGSAYGPGGVAPTGGGNGGNGSASSTGAGSAGSAPGGAGGGAYDDFAGGNGAAGQIAFTVPSGGFPTSSGAPAVAGGGAGGNGGATAGSAGSNGSNPGGGGGGGNSSGATEAGGTGGAGKLTVIPYQNAAFTTLLLHRPGLQAPAQLSPLITIGGAPGTAEYPVPPVTARTGAFTFEDGTTGGFTGVNASVANSGAWSNSGTASLLVTAAGGAGQWYAESPQQPVTPGQWVGGTVVVKNPNASTTLAHVQLNVNWYGVSGFMSTATDPPPDTSISASNTATLTTPAGGVQAPANAVGFTLVVADNETVSAGVKMGFDDLDFTVAPGAQFDGTYTILLAANTWNSPGSSRTITVTVNQYEASGGTKWSTSTTPVSVVPNTQVVNGIVVAGNLTLPYKALPKDNNFAFYTLQISDSNTSDTFYDVIFLDNNGQTVLINEASGGYVTFYVDEPDPRFDLGLHLGSQNGRPQAISISDAVQALSGGPLTLEPGDNKLLAWSLAGAPSLAVSYFPRWHQERLE